MKQARSDARKQAKQKRMEKAAELQSALEDRAAARAVLAELAELGRRSRHWVARLKIETRPAAPATRTSPVRKRLTLTPLVPAGRSADTGRAASSWAVDDLGMKGIIWQQSYLGRKSPNFYRGAARDNWEYDVRDEAVLLDHAGEPIVISNMGDDWIEIGAAWQALEDASTRANAKIQIRAIAPFDSDMSRDEMVDALTCFCETMLKPLGLPYSAVIHRPPEHGDARNFHPHIAFSLRPMRRVEPYCWEVADEVCGELDGKNGVQMLRHLWAHSMSEAAERAQRDVGYTGLGYGARGLDLEAGEHLGEGRSAIVRRGGQVWAHERNRIRHARNAARLRLRDADRKIAALTRLRDASIRQRDREQTTVRPAKVLRSAEPVKAAKALRAATADLAPRQQNSAAASLPRYLPLRSATPSRSATLLALSSPVTQAHHLHSAAPAAGAAFLAVSDRKDVQPAIVRSVAATVVPAAIRAPAGKVLPCSEKTGSVPPAAAAPSWMTELLHALINARAERARTRRQMLGRQHGARLDQIPSLDAVPTVGAIPTREQLEARAFRSAATETQPVASSEQPRPGTLAIHDFYVADYGDGRLDLDPPAMESIGVDETWLRQPQVQEALAEIRREQQRVVTAMARAAAARPLAFARSGMQLWPRDLDADHLRRLDRWAADPGFQHDVIEIELQIHRAHLRGDQKRRNATAARPDGERQRDRPTSIADGFGGRRSTPPPVFTDTGSGVRVEAFETRTGKPTDHLLTLLMLAGQHPTYVEQASDGRLTALPGGPALLAPLLHGWREDDRVAAFVTETVRASRQAGKAVWPAEVAAAVRAYAARTAGGSGTPPRPDLSRAPSR